MCMAAKNDPTHSKLTLPVAVCETHGDAAAAVVPSADHSSVEELDDFLASLSALQPNSKDEPIHTGA